VAFVHKIFFGNGCKCEERGFQTWGEVNFLYTVVVSGSFEFGLGAIFERGTLLNIARNEAHDDILRG